MKLLKQLQSGEISLELLKEKYGIKIREYGDRYVLNYDQIDSHHYRFDPIVKVCRQLIISKDFSKVLHRSFDRFYNFGEDPSAAEFDISKAVCEEKLDGSLIGLYFDGNEWCHCSKSLAYAEGPINNNVRYKTFGDLIKAEVDLTNVYQYGNKDYSYLFELMTPYIQHVTKVDKTDMYLLAVRNKITGEYLDRNEEGEKIKWKNYPKDYFFRTIEEIMSNVKELPLSEEGYVCRIGDWRIKIKSPAHIAASQMKDGLLTYNKIIHLVYLCEEPEYLSYYPEDTKYFEPWIKIREGMQKYLEDRFKDNCDENRKIFATNIALLPPILKSVLFKMYENGGRFKQSYIESYNKTQIEKLYTALSKVML